MVVYDPLERSIPPPPEENQGLDRGQMLSSIHSLQYLKSSHLNVPLSNEMFLKLNECFLHEQNRCSQVAFEMIE